MYQERSYRNRVRYPKLVSFSAMVEETDLHIQAQTNLEHKAIESILGHRQSIETCIERFPFFLTALEPVAISGPLPAIVRKMIAAGTASGVGPMAAVAGAVAESVCRDLLSFSDQVIVENGGDIFMKVNTPVTMAIYAGSSPLNMKVGLKISCIDQPVACCTSSGTIGHSLSMGKADAVTVIARSGALADAAATAIGNRVTYEKEIDAAIDFGQSIQGVMGLCIIKGTSAGFWGDVEVVRL